MHRFFIPQLYSEEMYIEGVDARHISKVLRMQPLISCKLSATTASALWQK